MNTSQFHSFAEVKRCENFKIAHYHYFNEAGVFVNCPFASKQPTNTTVEKWSQTVDDQLKGFTVNFASSSCIMLPSYESTKFFEQQRPKPKSKTRKTQRKKPADPHPVVLHRLLTFDSSMVKQCDVCTKMHFGLSKTCPYCGF